MTQVGKPKKNPLGETIAEPIPVKLPVRLREEPETVPDSHPIAAAFPESFAFSLNMKRTALEVVETFARDHFLRNDGAPITRRRVIRVTYETDTGDLHDASEEVVGECEIKGVEFGPDGTPTDLEKWNAIVSVAVEKAKVAAKKRVAELLTAGIEAEIEAAK